MPIFHSLFVGRGDAFQFPGFAFLSVNTGPCKMGCIVRAGIGFYFKYHLFTDNDISQRLVIRKTDYRRRDITPLDKVDLIKVRFKSFQ